MQDMSSRKRSLTAEEAELWLYSMRQAKALRRRERERERRKAKEESEAQTTAEPTASPASPPSDLDLLFPVLRSENGERGTALPRPPSRIGPDTGDNLRAPPLSRFDERQRRRLAKDTDLIEARLDLHGMHQREAYRALTSFLRGCAARGLRHVLVITGKGLPEIIRKRDYVDNEERGILRRLVPQWLAEPELRGLVVSYATSHARHGGEGALYVRLRKPSNK